MTRKHTTQPGLIDSEEVPLREDLAPLRSRNGLRLIKSAPDEGQRSGAQAKVQRAPQSRMVAFMKAFADAVDADVAALRRL